PPSTAGGLTGTPPVVMVDLAGGLALRDYVVANTGATVRINAATSYIIDLDWEDIVGGFSSRGPSQFEILKPDYIAPGVNILAAVAADGLNAVQYGFYQGTSMSSPHGAGAAALMVALHPTWSPAEVKSAMATTAVGGLFKENGVTPADPFDVGSGRLDLSLASTVGLVFNETGANYAAANPAIGGDPKTLNQPSVVNYNCTDECSWTRTVKSTLPTSASYTASFSGPAGMTATVTPSSFTINPGATQVFTITADVSALAPGGYAFGSVTLSTTANWPDAVSVADTHIPVVVVPALAIPVITVDADELSAMQTPNSQTTQTFDIGNEGGVDLEWEIAEAPVSMRLGLTLDASPDAALTSSPASFILDDGVGDDAIGLTAGGQFVWLNRFTPGAFNFPITIDQVDVMFGYPGNTGGVNVGELVDIYLYEDADGNTANGATHVASLTGQAVQAVDGTTWSTYTLATPVTFNGPGDILIAVVNRTAGVAAGTFPAVIDQTPPSQQRSWAGFGAVPGDPPVFPLPTFGIIDSFGIAGNWLVRGFGTANFPCENPADVPWLSVDPTTGTTGAAGTTNVSVTFDSTGLTPGDYSAFLCIESNDPDTPLVELPVMLEVSALPSIEVDIDEVESTQETDTQTTHTVVISNTGEANLNWYFEEAEGMMAGPVPAIMSSLTVGSDRANPQPNAAPASALSAAESTSASILPTSSNVINASWSEGFDDITLLPGMGWAIINNSTPVGTATWFQGNTAVFSAHSGAANSYIGVNFNSTTGANTISNWLLTPEMTMVNGDELTFWTRRTTSAFQDRLQVRLSTNGGSTDVGATPTSVGDFTELLLDINPTYAAGGYPQVWTEYTITISGLSGPANGRFAFRYFVENGGPSGANSDYIGIDTVSFDSSYVPPTVLYDNGPFITSFGDGPAGSDVSLLQNVSLGLTTLGAGVQFLDPGPHNRIADEFEVTTPGGWTVNNVVFYGYQTGSTTTSSFTGVNYRIWDGPPNDPNSNIVFGDTATNRFEYTAWAGAYRYAENAIGNTTRPVMQIVGESGIHLMPGTYWLDWQLAGTIASGPWQPPITIIGQNTTGNAMQMLAAGWTPFVDGGAGTPAQGAPFQLWGETVCDNPSDVSWISLDPDSGMTEPGEASEVEVTLDSTGVPAGHYVAYLCLNSDDPSNELIVMPVHMTVTETAYLRVAHLAPFAMDPGTAVTVTLNGAPALTDFAYGDSTTYIELPAGEYDVEIFPGSSASPAITRTVNLATGMYYSAVAIGDGVNQDLALLALADDNTAPAAGKFHLRLGHLAPFAAGATTADIRLQDGTIVVDDVDFSDVTAFIPLDAGTYDLKITTADGLTTLIDPLPVTFAEGDIVTAFATGEGVNQALGVFAWPVDVEGFFLPLVNKLFLPVIFK
ncbi:MAG: choice-of-anchor J domain-containing protein, partial [Chloroflexota bacterium]